MQAASIEVKDIEEGMLVGLKRPNDDSDKSKTIWRIAKTHGCGPFRVEAILGDTHVALVYPEGEQEDHFVEMGSGSCPWVNRELFEPWKLQD